MFSQSRCDGHSFVSAPGVFNSKFTKFFSSHTATMTTALDHAGSTNVDQHKQSGHHLTNTNLACFGHAALRCSAEAEAHIDDASSAASKAA